MARCLNSDSGRQSSPRGTRSITRFLVGWFLLLSGQVFFSAAAAPAQFHLGDDAAGPSCAYFTTMGHLTWTRSGGDWLDSAGQLHGNRPFAKQRIDSPRAGRQAVVWDITELAQMWQSKSLSNHGLLLVAQAAKPTGVVSFHSRESSDPTARPLLMLEYSDGRKMQLSPVADSYLDCSSWASLGHLRDIKVGEGQSTFLRFVLPEGPATLLKANLSLVTDRRYGAGVDVGVFRLAPSFARDSEKTQMGLASRFHLDEGIDSDPDVVFSTGFESFAWLLAWSYFSPRSNAETMDSDDQRKFEKLSGNALRVRFVKGRSLGLDLRYYFAGLIGEEPQEIYFRYYLRFADDWNPSTDGGKLPGISATYGRAGWGMRKSDGYNGWSMRGAFARRPSDASSVAGLTTLGSYAYHAEIEDSSGDYWGWSEGPSGLLENNRWYAIEQYVKLNTPGRNDGVFRAWVDGRPVLERTNVRYRDTLDLKIESIWLDVYYGGTAVAPKDMAMYIDNVVVARRYIGPVGP